MGIGINIAGTGIGLTQTIMNRKNKQAGQYDDVSGRVTHCTLHWFDDTQGNITGRRRKPDSLQTGGF